MEVSRRGMLLGALGVSGVSAAGAIAGPVGVDPFLATQSELNHLVDVAAQLKALWNHRDHLGSMSRQMRNQLRAKHLTPIGDEWLANIKRRFGSDYETEKASIQLNIMFAGRDIVHFPTTYHLRSLEGPTVAAAFLRAGLANYKLPFDVTKMPSFDYFHDLIRGVIDRSGPPISVDGILRAIPPEIRGPRFDDYVRVNSL